jgi:Zn-finger nucleic acid-binding protein
LFRDELRKLKNKVEHGSLRWLNDEMNNIDKTNAISGKRMCPRCTDSKMVSVIFGKSSLIIDYCQRCQGMWLDQDEFDSIIDYLKRERSGMRSKEIEQRAIDEAKALWSGSPESGYEQLLDIRATLSALVNAAVFDHPLLERICGIAR